MELQWIEQIIEALKNVGIPAQRGYPSGLMPTLTEPMATVSIQKAEANAMTATVQIYAQAYKDGAACEDLAVSAAAALRKLGAECKVGNCSFMGKGGLFTQPVLVSFRQEVEEETIEQPQVLIDGVPVVHVTGVSTSFTSTAVKGKNASTGAIIMVAGEKRWLVTVEDVIERTLSPQIEVMDGFRLRVIRGTEKEIYEGCCWDKITTEETEAGIRRVRVAITCNEPVREPVT